MLNGRLIVAAIVLALCATAAKAGDFAERHIFGFSPDGRYFAFEEYGVQDGSGFLYSNIYMIDVENDTWLPGTPQRMLVEDESVELADARVKAHRQIAGRMEEFQITAQPIHVASNPFTQLNADFNFVLFRTRPASLTSGKPYAIKLSAFPLPGPEYCADFGETHGFSLELIYGEDNTKVTLQNDEKLPKSRGCPLDYQIADIYTFHPESGPPVFAALIRVILVGFEGPDGRYMAITGVLPK